jgi:hypothetical protein
MSQAGGGEAAELAEIICEDVDLSDTARALLKPGLSASAYFDELNRAGLYADAIRVLARLLPNKRAIWWGSLCIWAVNRQQVSASTEAALRAIVTWLRNPEDNRRRAARETAKAAGLNSPVGMLAIATFLSEGSISVAGQPEVLAKPSCSATMIAAAVLTAARMTGASRSLGWQRQFLAIGVDVYRGLNLWER